MVPHTILANCARFTFSWGPKTQTPPCWRPLTIPAWLIPRMAGLYGLVPISAKGADDST